VKVAVIGGGIAGLAAAWELHPGSEVTLFEADRLGGKIRTEPFGGRPVECGPDAFITRTPDAVALCSELGMDDLIAPAAGRTLLWWDGRLRSLPDGLVLGVPRQLGPLITSGLLTPRGLLRAAADLVLPRRALPEDLSVRDLVTARFGAEVADRLVDPLVGGIHAGRTERLSSAATVPQLVEVARRSRSLLLGLRRSGGATPAGPTFLAPRLGLGSLVERMVGRLREGGVLFCPRTVTSVVADGQCWRVVPGDESFDAVVLATSAATAGRILAPDAPSELAQIPTVSVALVTLGYGPIDLPPGVNGVLVPPSSGWLMTACSFGSAKWPHWAAPGRTVLRVSAGRDGDERAFDLDDEALVELLATEVATALGMADRPDSWRVDRWPDSFPQYRVGHAALAKRITSGLRRSHPGVTVCGASYHGAGIPACISSGRAAARTIRQAVLEHR
jgi:protoporphyrinogen/coproporphyrinogen III oxidase